MNEDSLIWDQFMKGERSAFEKMYRREMKSLMSYGYSLVQNVEQVEEAVQDLFVELWQSRERLSPNNNIRSYLIVSLRRRLLKPSKAIIHDIETVPIMDTTSSFEQSIVDLDTAKRISFVLAKGINNLTEKQREIINLKFYHEMEYDQIAEVMGINYQSCRNLLSNAIKSLKLFIDQDKLFGILILIICQIFF
jgi:RNA polymerase sigma-70 factor (ECF subfamily)